MDFRYDIFPDKQLILQRYTGPFSLQELFSSSRSMWEDPRYCKTYNGIADLTRASINISTEDLETLIHFVFKHEKASVGRWAAIVSSPLGTAYALIFKRGILPKHSFEVFSTLEAACEHLNVVLPPAIFSSEVFGPDDSGEETPAGDLMPTARE